MTKLLFAVVACALLLAGCGGQESTSAGNPSGYIPPRTGSRIGRNAGLDSPRETSATTRSRAQRSESQSRRAKVKQESPAPIQPQPEATPPDRFR